jgi:hypothetical protein
MFSSHSQQRGERWLVEESSFSFLSIGMVSLKHQEQRIFDWDSKEVSLEDLFLSLDEKRGDDCHHSLEGLSLVLQTYQSCCCHEVTKSFLHSLISSMKERSLEKKKKKIRQKIGKFKTFFSWFKCRFFFIRN